MNFSFGGFWDKKLLESYGFEDPKKSKIIELGLTRPQVS